MMFGRVGRMLTVALLLGAGMAPLTMADNAPQGNATTASAAQAELAFFRAVAGGNVEVVQQLLADGVNVNATNVDGLTPLSVAITYNKLQILPILLNTPGVDVNKSCPLYYAVRDGKEEAVIQLLAAGADVNAMHKNDTPLITAVLFGKRKIVEILLATPGIDVNKTTLKTADTPLHKAAMRGDRLITPVLLAAPGIDVNAKNADGDTPLKLAEKFGSPQCAGMIRAAGGKK